jgi:hypothetical protein
LQIYKVMQHVKKCKYKSYNKLNMQSPKNIKNPFYVYHIIKLNFENVTVKYKNVIFTLL